MDHSDFEKGNHVSRTLLQGLSVCALLTGLSACGLAIGNSEPPPDPVTGGDGGGGASPMNPKKTSGMAAADPAEDSSVVGSGGSVGPQPTPEENPIVKACRESKLIPADVDVDGSWAQSLAEDDHVYVVGAFLSDDVGSGCTSTSPTSIYAARFKLDENGTCYHEWENGLRGTPDKSCIVVIDKFGPEKSSKPDIPEQVRIELQVTGGLAIMCGANPVPTKPYKVIYLDAVGGSCVPNGFKESDMEPLRNHGPEEITTNPGDTHQLTK